MELAKIIFAVGVSGLIASGPIEGVFPEYPDLTQGGIGTSNSIESIEELMGGGIDMPNPGEAMADFMQSALEQRENNDVEENTVNNEINSDPPNSDSEEYNRRVQAAWEEWDEEISEEQEEHFKRVQEINDEYAAKREEIIQKYDGDEENEDCQTELNTAEKDFQSQITEEDARFTNEFEEETMERDLKIHKSSEENYDEEAMENYFDGIGW